MNTLKFPYAALPLAGRLAALRLLDYNAEATWHDVEFSASSRRKALYDLAFPCLSEADARQLLREFGLAVCRTRGGKPVSRGFYSVLERYHPAMRDEIDRLHRASPVAPTSPTDARPSPALGRGVEDPSL